MQSFAFYAPTEIIFGKGEEEFFGISVHDNISRLSHIAGGICDGGIGIT